MLTLIVILNQIKYLLYLILSRHNTTINLLEYKYIYSYYLATFGIPETKI